MPSWSVWTSRRHLIVLTTRHCWRDLSLTSESMALHSLGYNLTFLNRIQYVKLVYHSSSPFELLAGVPQGSVLGPLLFTTYTSPLSNIITDFEASLHQYADNTSLFSILSGHSMSDQLKNLWKCTNSSMIGISLTFFN